MTSIRKAYSEVVKKAKKEIKDFYDINKGSKDPRFLAEDRIIKVFQTRAKEEFRTLK